MTIDSAPAKVAATSANVAQATANSATDGAQIQTDDAAPQTTGFQAIFQQLSQQISSEKTPTEAQATAPADAPKLPDLPDVPPPPIVNQQIAAELPVKELPKVQPIEAEKKDLPPESAPLESLPAKSISNLPANLKLPANAAEVNQPASDEVPEAKNPPEKPQKNAQVKCDAAALATSLPIQPVEIAKASPSEDAEQPQPVIPESNGKRKTVQVEKISLPKVKESDEVPAKEIQPHKVEADVEPAQISNEMPDEVPASTQDDPSPPQPKRIDSPKLEFTLPQPHITAKQIDQPAPPLPLPPEQAFIQANHPAIVSTIHGELLPNGGSMHIRMDPPELGALNVQIDVRDGIVTASFQTSNDEATRLLSHSLGQLRTTLESAGVSVEKLQVQQAPREHFNSNSRDSDRPAGQQAYERSAHDDRQRREMLQRMWRRLTVGRDELDLVA